MKMCGWTERGAKDLFSVWKEEEEREEENNYDTHL
jgi:hypothetical protein